VPHDGFTVACRCDEPVHHRRIVEPLAFTVGVDPRWAGLGELVEQSLDALEGVLRSATTAEFIANTMRRIGVGVGKVHGHFMVPFLWCVLRGETGEWQRTTR
jgi:hypothetical protein